MLSLLVLQFRGILNKFIGKIKHQQNSEEQAKPESYDVFVSQKFTRHDLINFLVVLNGYLSLNVL